jgi:hypothetical protein
METGFSPESVDCEACDILNQYETTTTGTQTLSVENALLVRFIPASVLQAGRTPRPPEEAVREATADNGLIVVAVGVDDNCQSSNGTTRDSL